MNKKYLVGVFKDEHTLVDAFEKALEKGVVIEEVYTPYPIHEVLEGMKTKTYIRHLAFFYGVLGVALLHGGMYYAAVLSWPLRFGGKPFNTFPSFIVVAVVGTILTISILTLLTFSIRARIYPGRKAEIMDHRATDNKFIILLNQDKMGVEKSQIIKLLQSNGATDIYEKDSNSTDKE